MIRFINLTNQIIKDEFNFAWYDTVRDEFIKVADSQVWDSWEDFKEDCQNFHCGFDFERFQSLFPIKYK